MNVIRPRTFRIVTSRNFTKKQGRFPLQALGLRPDILWCGRGPPPRCAKVALARRRYCFAESCLTKMPGKKRGDKRAAARARRRARKHAWRRFRLGAVIGERPRPVLRSRHAHGRLCGSGSRTSTTWRSSRTTCAVFDAVASRRLPEELARHATAEGGLAEKRALRRAPPRARQLAARLQLPRVRPRALGAKDNTSTNVFELLARNWSSIGRTPRTRTRAQPPIALFGKPEDSRN